MKLRMAFLCLNLLEEETYCHEVFERAPTGRCPVCGSEAIMPIGSLLTRANHSLIISPEPALFCSYGEE